MFERLQKIIARAGIASRRHAEQLILSGQVRVNGKVVTELGSKADPSIDKIEAAGRLIASDSSPRTVYLLLHKPPEVVSTLADPEGRKTLRNFLRGFPERVYPVGNLEYAASGLVFLTNDGDLAAKLLKKWNHIDQTFHIKIKGMLTLTDLDRIGREVRVHLKTIRQPEAARRNSANYWYQLTMQGPKLEPLRHVLFGEHHPVEKVMRIGLGSLSIEGIPRGRYRVLDQRDVDALTKPTKKPIRPSTKPKHR
jgi:23S rRNA pseudouridine2605 synthase